MKKIVIVNADPAEAEKLQKIFSENGYEAEIAAREADCPDAEMAIICKSSAQKFVAGGLSIDFSSRRVIADGRSVYLTPIEFKITVLLAKNQGVVLSHEQIISEIWGPFNSDNLLLRVNMSNIRKKIEADPANPQYILTETGVGYYMKK